MAAVCCAVGFSSWARTAPAAHKTNAARHAPANRIDPIHIDHPFEDPL
jgi:hypothetical protein